MGRRRKTGARTKSGRLSRGYRGPARDTGTHEAHAKRQALVGVNELGDPSDPAFAESSIGILFSNRYINREQYNMAQSFCRSYCVVIRPPWPRHVGHATHNNCRAGFCTKADCEAKRPGCLRRTGEKFDAMLKALTEYERQVVTNIAVYNHLPMFFVCDRIGRPRLPEDNAEERTLVDGLNALLGRRSGKEAA